MLDNVGDASSLTAGKFPHKTAVINFPITSPFFEVHFATAKIGAVGVPPNVRLVGRELQSQVHHAEAVAVIFHGAFAKTVSSLRKELPTVRHFIRDGSEGDGVLALRCEDLRCGRPRSGAGFRR